VQDAEFGKNVEFRKLFGFLLCTVRISLGGFGNILPARVLVPYFEAKKLSAKGWRDEVLVRTNVKPLWDETNLSSDRPSSDSFSECVGMRHSCSKS
jgi:hypothetical protein